MTELGNTKTTYHGVCNNADQNISQLESIRNMWIIPLDFSSHSDILYFVLSAFYVFCSIHTIVQIIFLFPFGYTKVVSYYTDKTSKC